MFITGKKGFTLLEVMVASVIGAFIALVAVSTLRAVAAGRVRLDENVSAAEEIRYAAEVIRQDLTNIYRDANFSNMRLVGIIPEDSEIPSTNLLIRVVSDTKARQTQMEGHLYDVQYSLVEKGDKKLFLRRKCPVIGVEKDEEIMGGMLTPIAESIIAFDVRYFDTVQWLQEWPRESRELPSLMEISLTAVTGDREAEKPKIISKSFIVNFPRLQQQDDDQASQITDLDNLDTAGSPAEVAPSPGGDR